MDISLSRKGGVRLKLACFIFVRCFENEKILPQEHANNINRFAITFLSTKSPDTAVYYKSVIQAATAQMSAVFHVFSEHSKDPVSNRAPLC